MCRQMILLARNDQQAIFTCEHGTIHLTHQQTTVCLMQDEFRRMANYIVNGDLCGLNQSGLGCVREASPEHADLWIGSGGFHLTIQEFFALTDLLRAALLRLNFLQSAMRAIGRPPMDRHSLN